MSIKSYDDYRIEEKGHHGHGYPSLTLIRGYSSLTLILILTLDEGLCGNISARCAQRTEIPLTTCRNKYY